MPDQHHDHDLEAAEWAEWEGQFVAPPRGRRAGLHATIAFLVVAAASAAAYIVARILLPSGRVSP